MKNDNLEYIYIYKLLSWLDKYVNQIYKEMIIEIRNIINNNQSSGRSWSKQIDKVLDENCEYAINLNHCIELTKKDKKIP